MEPKPPDHLLVLVHGLADTLHAWDNCVKELRKLEPSSRVLVYASAVNARLKTHDGFDKCGERLAVEIRELVQRQPQLNSLSVIGHSMGGMIARYALGVLYNPPDRTICGLRPIHFITLATPHLGLTVDDGPAQVPFVAWAGGMPLLGRSVKSALQAVAHWVAATLFRGTGRHFLALDGTPGELPLLMLLAMDAPDRGQYFFSALEAFASRACYGNVGRDHWVSWENATLRDTEDLPNIPPDAVRHGRGVVLEDSPEAGISPRLLLLLPAAASLDSAAKAVPFFPAAAATSEATEKCGTVMADVPGTVNATARDVVVITLSTAAVPEPVVLARPGCGESLVAGHEAESGGGGGEGGRDGAAAPVGADARGASSSAAAAAVALERSAEAAVELPQQVVYFALRRLRQLRWRRVDVSFAGSRIGTAHNNIQATRWTNRVGFSVLEHLRGHLQAVNHLLAGEAGSGKGRPLEAVHQRGPEAE